MKEGRVIDSSWIHRANCLRFLNVRAGNVLANLKDANPSILCPEYEEILRPFSYFAFEDTKRVLIGEEPYYTADSTGIPFLVQKNDRAYPSARNFKRVLATLGYSSIEELALRKKTLLVNRRLTTIAGVARAHESLYTRFIYDLISDLSHLDKISFLLVGKSNYDLKTKIKEEFERREHKYQIFLTPHPSPRVSSNFVTRGTQTIKEFLL